MDSFIVQIEMALLTNGMSLDSKPVKIGIDSTKPESTRKE